MHELISYFPHSEWTLIIRETHRVQYNTLISNLHLPNTEEINPIYLKDERFVSSQIRKAPEKELLSISTWIWKRFLAPKRYLQRQQKLLCHKEFNIMKATENLNTSAQWNSRTVVNWMRLLQRNSARAMRPDSSPIENPDGWMRSRASQPLRNWPAPAPPLVDQLHPQPTARKHKIKLKIHNKQFSFGTRTKC